MIGIDLFAVVVFGIAFVFAQIRTVPLRLRYTVLSVACGVIAAVRLSKGTAGVGLLFVAISAGLAVYYAVKAIRTPSR
ncbi:MAG: hypothetical protein ACT4TC_07755 [Myxococcaceae bacterium]